MDTLEQETSLHVTRPQFLRGATCESSLADKALLPPGLEVVIRGHGGLVLVVVLPGGWKGEGVSGPSHPADLVAPRQAAWPSLASLQ